MTFTLQIKQQWNAKDFDLQKRLAGARVGFQLTFHYYCVASNLSFPCRQLCLILLLFCFLLKFHSLPHYLLKFGYLFFDISSKPGTPPAINLRSAFRDCTLALSTAIYPLKKPNLSLDHHLFQFLNAYITCYFFCICLYENMYDMKVEGTRLRLGSPTHTWDMKSFLLLLFYQ